MKIFCFSTMALIALSMASCGGGSDSGGSNAGTWTVDSTRQYARKSSTQDAPLAKTPSTVAYSEGDCGGEVPRSDYQRCSIISFGSHRDLGPGEYPVNPNHFNNVNRTQVGVTLTYVSHPG